MIYKVCLFLVGSIFAQSASIPDTIFAPQGGSITIPLSVYDLENVEGIDVDFAYDGNIISSDSVFINSSLLENYSLVYNQNQENVLEISIYALSELFSGGGIVAYLHFSILGEPGDSSQIVFTDFVTGELGQGDESHIDETSDGIIFVGTTGCMDTFACNYDFEFPPDFDDGSCLYLDCYDECGGTATYDCSGECEGQNVCGCMDPMANNYLQNATYDDGSCEYTPPDWFQFNISTQLSFYLIFEVFDINGEYAEATDWIGAFKCDLWNSDTTSCLQYGEYEDGNEICVGARRWSTEQCSGGICDVPVYGNDGNPGTEGYLETGDIPAFVFFDSSELSFYSAVPSEIVPWEQLNIPLINSLIANEFIFDLNTQKNNSIFEYKLLRNYPNPFNPKTTIEYEIVNASKVSIEIVNLGGKKIETLTTQFHTPGYYKTVWDGSIYSSGIYFIVLNNSETLLKEKIILLK